MKPVRDILVGNTPALIEPFKPYLNFIELPAFRLDEGSNRFGGKERLRSASTFGERFKALLGVGVDANGQGCGHLWHFVSTCIHSST